MIQSLYLIIVVGITTIVVASLFQCKADYQLQFVDYVKVFSGVVISFIFYLFSKIYCLVLDFYIKKSLYLKIFEKIVLPSMTLYLSMFIVAKIDPFYGQSITLDTYKVILFLFLLLLWADALYLMRGLILKNKELSHMLKKIINNEYSFLYMSYPPKSALDVLPFLVLLFVFYAVIIIKLSLYS